jgi:splicing factor 3B subunit 5
MNNVDLENDSTDQQFKYKMQVQFEKLDAKNPSAGNANTTKFELVQNQHRDSSALLIAHDSMLQTIAIGENISMSRARYQQLQNMSMPVGLEASIKMGDQ